jgi:hypothetical protein
MAVTFFISYKRGDAETERLLPPLRTALKDFGYQVFVDVDIDIGKNWEEELRHNIECADEFLLLLSAAAAKSERVEDEVRIADTFRNSKNKKPRVLPIYINLEDGPENPALKRILDPIEHLKWKSEGDTSEVAARIRAMVRARRRPAVIAKATVAIAAALLIVLFVHSVIQIVQLRSARSSVTDARAAHGRLRSAERLLVPHLWLVGPWRPDALLGQSLDEHAAPMLVSNRRNDLDQGLLLSAEAAALRGGNVTDTAQRVYNEQHYELLVTSAAASEEIAGRSLAVTSNASEWRIALGGHIWNCAEPIELQPCVVSPVTSRLPVVVAASFDSHDTLRLVGYSGEETRLNLLSGEEPSREGNYATFVAADRGDVATSFDHVSAVGPSVKVDAAGTALRPRSSGDLGRLKMLAFGPCDGCIATLGIDGAVKIWRWSPDGAVRPIVPAGTALLLASSSSGHRLALIDSKGDLTFYSGADTKPEGDVPVIDLRAAESMAMSPDGHRLAVVHGGNVTIFEDGAAFWTLVAATKQPASTAVAFAGNEFLVTRTPNDARVWRFRSTERREIGPEQRLVEWRKKFGLSGAATGAGKD